VNIAFITGVTGQDGAHMAAQLIEHGWIVYGGHRRGSSSTTWRLDYLGITEQVRNPASSDLSFSWRKFCG
jgi:GDPmannose 4,6-dehydratase